MLDKLIVEAHREDAAFTVGNGGVMFHISALIKWPVDQIMSSVQVKQIAPFFDLIILHTCVITQDNFVAEAQCLTCLTVQIKIAKLKCSFTTVKLL